MNASHSVPLDSRIESVSPNYHSSALRCGVERAAAMVALVVISPLLAALWVAVRVSSRGPAIYQQERLGLGGKPFQILKFRSMVVDAEKGTGAVWSTKGDPRVTPLGRVMRKLHLDELPQLVNIARGEMSFVGPRPERPEFVRSLMRQIPGYSHRLAVRPGVTGLAQVNLPPDESVECVKRKFELDVEYLFTASPSLDLRLIACTVLKMAAIPRSVATAITLVSRNPSRPQLAPAPATTERPAARPAVANPAGAV